MKKNNTLFIAEVDGDGVAITWDERLTDDQAKKVQEFVAQLIKAEEVADKTKEK